MSLFWESTLNQNSSILNLNNNPTQLRVSQISSLCVFNKQMGNKNKYPLAIEVGTVVCVVEENDNCWKKGDLLTLRVFF